MTAATGQRTALGATRATGQLTDWKGTFGWITPSVPIAHAQAKMHGGKVYVSQADVEAEIAGVGAAVSFVLYSDATGLGAGSVRPAAASAGRALLPAPASAMGAARASPYARPPATAPPGHQAMAARNGAAPGKGAWPAQNGKNQRQIVSNAKISGEVTQVNGPTGWISTAEEIKHPQYRGKIYVHQGDMLNGVQLEAGLSVQFLVYSDNQGLGASNVTAVGAEGEAAEDYDEEEDPLRKLLGFTEEQVDAAEGRPKAEKSRPKVALPTPVARGAAKQAAKQPAKPPATKPPAKLLAAAAAAPEEALEEQAPAAAPPQAQERERVAESITGEVVEWTRNIGWLRAHEPISHPEANRRGGKIYLAKRDVMGEEELPVGAVVQFNVYADASGLGADDCIAL